jgi:hypothetical protein
METRTNRGNRWCKRIMTKIGDCWCEKISTCIFSLARIVSHGLYPLLLPLCRMLIE